MVAKSKQNRVRKYEPELFIRMFRKATKFRNELLRAGFTDNGGAIHSAERIMHILGMRLNRPDWVA
jgi:hypothetical protein